MERGSLVSLVSLGFGFGFVFGVLFDSSVVDEDDGRTLGPCRFCRFSTFFRIVRVAYLVIHLDRVHFTACRLA